MNERITHPARGTGSGSTTLKNLFKFERDCEILHLTHWGTVREWQLYKTARRFAQGGTGERLLPCVANFVFWGPHAIHLSPQEVRAVGF